MIDTQAIRSKILDLAMRGKLTEQLPEDGTAEELYRQIQKEKQALAHEGKIRGERPLPKIGENEIPFAIPENWKWIRLNELGVFCGGKTPSMANKAFWKNGSINWVTSKDMKQKYITASEMMITEEAARELNLLPAQTVLFVVRSGILRRLFPVAILKTNGTINQDLKALKLFIPGMCEFVYCLLKGFEATILFKYTKDGTTVHNIVFDDLLTMPVPLPPLAEQHRIVARIEQAFSALDTIDTLQAKYADNLAVLKSKLIDAAIQGKLTKQLPEDGTAEELYRQIQAEKQSLIKAGKIKKEKPLPEISADEIPFEIPPNWKWVALGNITSKITSGSTPSGGSKSDVYVSSGFPLFREQNIYDDGIHQAGMVFISAELLEKRQNSTVKAKDILLNITGGSIGRCALVPDSFDRGSINQHILIIRTVEPETRFFIHMLICSPYVQSYIKSKAVGDKDGFSGGRCKRLLVPLPPLAEQKRIVAKLEEVLKMIEA